MDVAGIAEVKVIVHFVVPVLLYGFCSNICLITCLNVDRIMNIYLFKLSIHNTTCASVLQNQHSVSRIIDTNSKLLDRQTTLGCNSNNK